MLSRLRSLFARPATATDPVCGMTVDTARPGGGTCVHEGKTYYFCGPGCRTAFAQEPQAYLSGDKRTHM